MENLKWKAINNKESHLYNGDKLLAKKKEEEDAIKLIEESKERIFNLSFDQQDWEHDWNLEEYQKNIMH